MGIDGQAYGETYRAGHAIVIGVDMYCCDTIIDTGQAHGTYTGQAHWAGSLSRLTGQAHWAASRAASRGSLTGMLTGNHIFFNSSNSPGQQCLTKNV